jgi:hypothetical protein
MNNGRQAALSIRHLNPHGGGGHGRKHQGIDKSNRRTTYEKERVGTERRKDADSRMTHKTPTTTMTAEQTRTMTAQELGLGPRDKETELGRNDQAVSGASSFAELLTGFLKAITPRHHMQR